MWATWRLDGVTCCSLHGPAYNVLVPVWFFYVPFHNFSTSDSNKYRHILLSLHSPVLSVCDTFTSLACPRFPVQILVHTQWIYGIPRCIALCQVNTLCHLPLLCGFLHWHSFPWKSLTLHNTYDFFALKSRACIDTPRKPHPPLRPSTRATTHTTQLHNTVVPKERASPRWRHHISPELHGSEPIYETENPHHGYTAPTRSQRKFSTVKPVKLTTFIRWPPADVDHISAEPAKSYVVCIYDHLHNFSTFICWIPVYVSHAKWNRGTVYTCVYWPW